MKETFRTIHLHKRSTVNRKQFTVNRKLYTAPLLRLALLVALPLLMLAACVSPSERQHMETMLADYEQRNSQYDTLNIDSTRRLADFFSRHGDAHQRMRAYYLLGCAHETAGESPQALDLFYKSLEQADTTASDCDYKRLSRIHGQIAAVYNKQRAPQLEIAATHQAIRFAWKAKDTLAAIKFYECLCEPYYFMSNRDSALLISQHSKDSYNQYGLLQYAHDAYLQTAFYHLELGEFVQAFKGIQETDSFWKRFDHINKPGLYYYNKALYYEGTNQLDSALRYFNLLSHTFKDRNNAEAASKGLMSVYNKLGIADSATKYAMLYCQANDSGSIASSSEEIVRMHAIYNYSASERKAMEKEREAWVYKNAIVFIVILALLLSFAVARFIRHQKQASQNEQMAANAEYSKLLLRFNQAQQDLALFQSDDQKFCLQKEKEMEILREKLSLLRGNYGMAEQWTLEQTMLNSPVITELHEQASKTSKPSRAQWVDLLSLAERELPLLYKKLTSSEPPLTDQEMIAALLIRLQFTQGELASLLGVSKQRVNNIKRNINKKIFQQEGAVTLNGNIFSI